MVLGLRLMSAVALLVWCTAAATAKNNPCGEGLGAFEAPAKHARSNYANAIRVVTRAESPDYTLAACASLCSRQPTCTRFAYQAHDPAPGQTASANACIVYHGTESTRTGSAHAFDLYVRDGGCVPTTSACAEELGGAYSAPAKHTRDTHDNAIAVVTRAKSPGYTLAACAALCSRQPTCTRFAYQAHDPAPGQKASANACIVYHGTAQSTRTGSAYAFDLYARDGACAPSAAGAGSCGQTCPLVGAVRSMRGGRWRVNTTHTWIKAPTANAPPATAAPTMDAPTTKAAPTATPTAAPATAAPTTDAPAENIEGRETDTVADVPSAAPTTTEAPTTAAAATPALPVCDFSAQRPFLEAGNCCKTTFREYTKRILDARQETVNVEACRQTCTHTSGCTAFELKRHMWRGSMLHTTCYNHFSSVVGSASGVNCKQNRCFRPSPCRAGPPTAIAVAIDTNTSTGFEVPLDSVDDTTTTPTTTTTTTSTTTSTSTSTTTWVFNCCCYLLLACAAMFARR